jgi:hypothetical protein
MMALAFWPSTTTRPTKLLAVRRYTSRPLTRATWTGADLWRTATSQQNPYADVKAQKTFEKGLLDKTAKQTGDSAYPPKRTHLVPPAAQLT